MLKHLVICVVGDRSHHTTWRKSKKRQFDLMLVYYGVTKDKYKEDADYYLHTSGMFKLENIAFAVEKHSDIIRKYDAVFLPDDDMAISTSSINRLFNTFFEFKLDLASPTISSGFISHEIERTLPGYILRYSNFVSMGCPIFKTHLLLELLPLFTLTRSGWGIDVLWSSKCKDKTMAIIDCVSLVHVRRHQKDLGDRTYYQALKKLNVDANAECRAIIDKYELTHTPKVYKRIRYTFPLFFLAQINYLIRHPKAMIRHIISRDSARIKSFYNSEVYRSPIEK